MQKVSTNPAARHNTRTFTNSLVRYFIFSAPYFFCGDATKPSFLRLSTSQRSLDLLQVQPPGGFKRAARGARGEGLSDPRSASL